MAPAPRDVSKLPWRELALIYSLHVFRLLWNMLHFLQHDRRAPENGARLKHGLEEKMDVFEARIGGENGARV
jgi:hypothetical protein